MAKAITFLDRTVLMETAVIIRDVNPVFGKPDQSCATLKLLSQDRTGWSFLTYDSNGIFVSYAIQDEITGHVAKVPWEELSERQQAFLCECISEAMEFAKTPVNRLSALIRSAATKVEEQYGV